MAGSGGRARRGMRIVWPMPAHTAAKHRLLRAYLSGWYPILARHSGQILYLDAFAGPGIYAGGEPGSPIVALDTLLGHSRLPSLGGCEFRFNFLEAHPGRLAELRAQLEALKAARGGWPANISVRTAQDTFEVAAQQILTYLQRKSRPLPPTFAFIDPFGAKGLPMQVIGRLLDADKCEVCVHFMLGGVNRWIRSSRPNAHVHNLFGTEEYREAEGMRGAQRQRFLLNLYKRQLREVGNFRHVCSFSLFGIRNQWISAIVYGTNHLRGMEVMKRAMWSVDPVDGGRFSDRDYAAGQQSLFQFAGRERIDDALGRELAGRFRARRLPVEEIAEFVVTETDFGPQHWRGALRELERAQLVRVVSGPLRHRAASFPTVQLSNSRNKWYYRTPVPELRHE
jgi:three-Cys-motif partner protein